MCDCYNDKHPGVGLLNYVRTFWFGGHSVLCQFLAKFNAEQWLSCSGERNSTAVFIVHKSLFVKCTYSNCII